MLPGELRHGPTREGCGVRDDGTAGEQLLLGLWQPSGDSRSQKSAPRRLTG